MTEVVWHRKARRDVFEAVFYYANRDLQAAQCFLDEIESTVERIRDLTAVMMPPHDDFLHLNMKRFPFYIGYTIRSRRVWILTVSSGRRRDRTSWKHRGSRLE